MCNLPLPPANLCYSFAGCFLLVSDWLSVRLSLMFKLYQSHFTNYYLLIIIIKLKYSIASTNISFHKLWRKGVNEHGWRVWENLWTGKWILITTIFHYQADRISLPFSNSEGCGSLGSKAQHTTSLYIQNTYNVIHVAS